MIRYSTRTPTGVTGGGAVEANDPMYPIYTHASKLKTGKLKTREAREAGRHAAMYANGVACCSDGMLLLGMTRINLLKVLASRCIQPSSTSCSNQCCGRVVQ